MNHCKSKYGTAGCRAGVRCPQYVNRFVPRDGKLKEYYAATDVKHFGDATVAGSKFTNPEVTCVEDVVKVLVGEGRDVSSDDDRQVFIDEHGCDEGAFFDGFRYLKVNTAGTVGVVRSDVMSDDARVSVLKMKPGAPCSLVVEVAEQPSATFGTVIMSDDEDGSPYVVTCFPGLPVSPAVDDRFEEFAGGTVTVAYAKKMLGVDVFWLNTRLV